jgi:hypothetical protein
MYGRKHMGDVLQCHHLAVPGLRGAKWVRKSIKERFRVQGSGAVIPAKQTVSQLAKLRIWVFCLSGLDPESSAFSRCYATGCRVKPGMTGKN